MVSVALNFNKGLYKLKANRLRAVLYSAVYYHLIHLKLHILPCKFVRENYVIIERVKATKSCPPQYFDSFEMFTS